MDEPVVYYFVIHSDFWLGEMSYISYPPVVKPSTEKRKQTRMWKKGTLIEEDSNQDLHKNDYDISKML